MPLWTVEHSQGVLDADERRQLAELATDLYDLLPRFYVAVAFHERAPEELYVGGEPARRFVRIAVDHIARTLPNAGMRARWMARINHALTPFMAERSLDWEIHIDETSSELWSIQGLLPPPPDSDAERRWKRENRPSSYDV